MNSNNNNNMKNYKECTHKNHPCWESSFQTLFITVFICKMLQKKKYKNKSFTTNRILFIIRNIISPPQNCVVFCLLSHSLARISVFLLQWYCKMPIRIIFKQHQKGKMDAAKCTHNRILFYFFAWITKKVSFL